LKHLALANVYRIINLAIALYPPKEEADPELFPFDKLDELSFLEWSEERKALFNYIDGLSISALLELTALFWLGRDGDSSREWDGLIKHAKITHDEHSAAYLAGKTNLAKCLRKGLRIMQQMAC